MKEEPKIIGTGNFVISDEAHESIKIIEKTNKKSKVRGLTVKRYNKKKK